MNRPDRAGPRAAGGVLLVAALALGGCGVPRASEPVTLDASAVPYRLLDETSGPTRAVPSRTATAAPAPDPRVWFVTADDRLTAVAADLGGLTGAPAAERLLAALLAGPGTGRQGDGLRTLLPGGTQVRLLGVEQGRAMVEIGFGDVPPSPSALPAAVGQVVLTLTSVPGVRSVALMTDGGPAPVPLPDGRLVERPVTAQDYAGLRESSG